MSERFFIHELPNGMTLLGQPMEHVSSAAFTLVLPAGAAYDPPDLPGAGSVACEWCLRGAGERDTRQLNDALDALGCQHNESVRSEHLLITAAQLGRNLPAALGIFADIVRRPALAEETFAPSRALVEQDLQSLEDEPGRKCSLLLRERFYPHPLGRCCYGTAEGLAAMTPGAIREHIAGHFTPAGTILAVAGDIDFPAVRAVVEDLFGDWSAPPAAPPAVAPAPGGAVHIPKDSAQVHIGLAHRAAPMGHELYYAARIAEMVLSGGASARLHTEIREKLGLVYHVSSHYHSLREHAGMFTYAGTRPDLARRTLETTIAEIRRLAEGIDAGEVARARTQLKSALVMQGESTSARANALASDYYHLRRLRPLAELSAAVDAVTPGDVLEYLEAFPAESFTSLTIGPEPIDVLLSAASDAAG